MLLCMSTLSTLISHSTVKPFVKYPVSVSSLWIGSSLVQHPQQNVGEDDGHKVRQQGVGRCLHDNSRRK